MTIHRTINKLAWWNETKRNENMENNWILSGGESFIVNSLKNVKRMPTNCFNFIWQMIEATISTTFIVLHFICEREKWWNAWIHHVWKYHLIELNISNSKHGIGIYHHIRHSIKNIAQIIWHFICSHSPTCVWVTFNNYTTTTINLNIPTIKTPKQEKVLPMVTHFLLNPYWVFRLCNSCILFCPCHSFGLSYESHENYIICLMYLNNNTKRVQSTNNNNRNTQKKSWVKCAKTKNTNIAIHSVCDNTIYYIYMTVTCK